jgi:Acetoacetate decarboxylase (ADC)
MNVRYFVDHAVAILLSLAFAAPSAAQQGKPITDFADIAGTWVGTVTSAASGNKYAEALTIRPDGSYESSGMRGRGTGTLRLVDGKALYKGDQSGRTGVFTLHEERDGSRRLLAAPDDRSGSAEYFTQEEAQARARRAAIAPGFYDPVPLDDPAAGRCELSFPATGPYVYQESDDISAYFEAQDLAAYRLAVPAAFAMPQTPLIRVSILDFYGMAVGPAYLEAVVSVLVLHEGRPGWFILTMPVTNGDSCASGRAGWGYPKVVRRVTLERQSERYIGTLYSHGGRAPELSLTLEIGDPGDAAREVLRAVYGYPNHTLKDGRVMAFGGLSRPVYELERTAPGVWKVALGQARLQLPRESDTLLQRLGVGRPIAAYWARQRLRYSIRPN